MASRYPPTARDRSPPRYDRRPSSTSFTPTSQRDPPRGPKADFRGGGSNFAFNPAPRGRGAGFPARPNDGWDRDRDRDTRTTPQSYRRDDDRPDWSRRDRDFPPSDRALASTRDNRPFGRERSASPIRSRRDSRESIPPTFSRLPDSTYYAPAGRGGPTRGRGRGDWDRGRGRSSFVGERDRDLFHPRSRSRESWRDREFERGRPPPGDADRPGGYDRREYDRSREREVRGRDSREHDIWQRDPSPARTSNLNTAGSVSILAASTIDRPGKTDFDIGRRASVVAAPTNTAREIRRDGEPTDYFGSSRLDSSRRDPPQSSQQPPAAVGLDYGPPPSLPSVTTPVVEKPASIKPQPSRPEPATPSLASFQPPSGPKAGRTINTVSLGQAGKPASHQDTWARTEPASRSIRSSLVPTVSHTPIEGVARKDGLPTEPRPAATAAAVADRLMPPNVPSGPRSGNAPLYKQRIPSTEPGSLPPSQLDIRPAVIPTGPRFERDVVRPVHPPNPKSWAISSNDRPGFVPTGPRQNTYISQPQKPRITHTSGSPVPTGPRGPPIATSPRLQEAKMTLLPPRKPMDRGHKSQEDVEMSTSASSEDEDEAEDDSFDEEYYAESEERHKQEMKVLETRKPPPLLEDPAAIVLLFKLQFLEMISLETALQPLYAEDEGSQQEMPLATTLPADSPPLQQAPIDSAPDEEQQGPNIQRRPLKQQPINPRLTPPIDTLPYFKSGLPKREVFKESENEVEHEAVAILLQQEFEREAWDLRADLDEMHAEFKFKYPLWKQEVNLIEHERREQQVSPAPVSPAPSAAPSVTPSLTHERTRGARNTTEADLEAALLLSRQSAKEEEERREREAAASSLPNFDMEAVIPSMLRPADVERSQFEDTNNLVPHDLLKHEFAYRPPEDDFTEEEQTLFIAAYCQTPKKWSKIAESMSGRTYQDCIQHYYLTKDQARYKEIFKRSQPRKRGRGKAANKPRSTALMSELLRGGDDGEGTLVAVTDSGRPRRAAAPTFGDAPSEADPSTPVPQSRRLTAAPSNPDSTAPKTSRGRKTGSGTKPRRTKAQMQADQQQALLLSAAEASPGRAVPAAKGDRGRTTLRVEMGITRPDVIPASQAQRIVEAGLQQYPVSEMSLIPAIAQAATTSAVTSYWSVPEQHKFPELLAYFGRDFAAIADFMKTKSVTMIKNYYSRQLNDGKDEFERIALVGEQRRMAGEVIPQPPSPIAPAKRRYDTGTAGPLAPATRPLQPDQMLVDSDPIAPAIKQSIMDDFSQEMHDRNATGDPVTKPRTMIRETPRELPLAGVLVAKTEETSRISNDRIPLFGQKPHGPRAGFFQDDVGLQTPRQGFRQQLQEHSPQILAQRLPDMSRSDVGQQPTMPIMAQSLHSQQDPPLQALQRTQRPSAPVIPPLQSHAEKYQPSLLHPSGHSRNNSLTAASHSALDTPELSSLRRIQSQRPLFGATVTGSPALAATPMPMSHIPRTEISQSTPLPPAPEPPKPPAKRSNVFGLLNDDPPDPPPKRPSLETQKRATVLSPRNAPLPPAQNPLQHPRGQIQSEDPMSSRTMRDLYGQGNVTYATSRQQSSADYPSVFSNPSAAPPSSETWMDRFDPRTQGALSEQRNHHHHSPAPSQYSVVPPGSQPPLMHAMRVDSPRGLERPIMDHRRALLGQMNQIPHVPSPPPQQPTQPVPLLRSASTSSQHSRVPSIGYPNSQQNSQSSSLGHPPAPQTHPQSTSSTPVPSLHHRAQSSLDIRRKLTIQQHMAQQSQNKQEQQREHDRQIQIHREMEAATAHRQREQREREREHQQQHMRRDIYGIEHNHMAFGPLGPLHQQPPATQHGAPPMHLPHYHPGAHPAHHRSLSKGEERR